MSREERELRRAMDQLDREYRTGDIVGLLASASWVLEVHEALELSR